jgi:hypothetical protein
VRAIKVTASILLGIVLGALLFVTCAFELGYRYALSVLGDPLLRIDNLPAVPPKVAEVMWAAIAKRSPSSVPRVYGWTFCKRLLADVSGSFQLLAA